MTVLQESHHLVSDRTLHHVRSTGDGGWVVNYLPGQTLSRAQTQAALLALEDMATLRTQTGLLAPVLDVIGKAATECPWLPPSKEGLAARALAWAGVSR